MIHIHGKKDIHLVEDKIIQDGLRKEFERLPNDFIYPEYGYFIVIESLHELQQSIPLIHGSINQISLTDNIEMIEEFDGYHQIVCSVYTDFGVSLFIRDTLLNKDELTTYFGI